MFKKLKEFSHFLIPLKNIPEIIKILEEANTDIDIDFDKHQIAFSYNGVYLTSRVIDGVFPDYKQIIPKDYTSNVIVLKQDIVNSLKVANVFSDKFNQINLKIDPKTKTFEVKTKNTELGENTNKLDAVVKGDPVDINFNFKYIGDCFQSINSDSVSLSFNGSNRPMVVSGVSDKTFTYLVMSMNK
jgi:DNA polymerase-3 subunit beta